MRVLVMRPRAESEAVAAMLREGGHQPVVAPLVTIVPLTAALPAGRPDAVLFTSQHAPAALPGAMREALATLPAYAVGATTAAAARAAGFTDVRIGAGDGAGLADLVRLTLPRGALLLYCAGQVRKTALPEGLAAAGYALATIEVYAVSPVTAWATTVKVEPGDTAFEGCLHFSRASAVAALTASRGTPIEASFDAAVHLCLSADVAAPLHAAGLPSIAVASSPTVASLMQCLSARMG